MAYDQGQQPQFGMQQPPAAPPASVTNVVVTMQPQQNNQLLLVPLQGHRTWTTGLFDCFSDIPSCLLTFFCMPCMEAQIASRTGECFCTPCCIPGSALALRARVRTAGGITGNLCNDCCTLAFCGPCAVCQMSRELTNMGIP